MLVINAIGLSDSGKTTLLEAITRYYTTAGKKVAIIKDIHSEKYEPDMKGKDTWRYAQAGANLVVGRGIRDTVFRWRQPMSLLEIVGQVKADVLLVEGFKDQKMPHIACASEIGQLDKLVDTNTYCISGVISERIQSYRDLPVWNGTRDFGKILSLAEKHSARWE